MDHPFRGGPIPYDGPMVRVHNPHTGIQIHTTEEKAARLTVDGGYREGPFPDPANKPDSKQTTAPNRA